MTATADGELGPEARVTYTVREVLDEQTALLRAIDAKMDAKADKADIASVHARVDGHEIRIQGLEDRNKATDALADARGKSRRRVWAFVAAVVVPVGVALILVFMHP